MILSLSLGFCLACSKDTSDFKYLIKARSTELADDSIYDKLLQFSLAKEKKKLKLLPGKCVIAIQEWTEPDPKAATTCEEQDSSEGQLLRINPSLFPLLPLPSSNDSAVVKEVQKFENKADAACAKPYLGWVNNLYIYPSALSLKGFSGELPRTLGVVVKLLNSDADPNAPGLQVGALSPLDTAADGSRLLLLVFLLCRPSTGPARSRSSRPSAQLP